MDSTLVFLGLAFSSLFTIVNPFSAASIFLAITKGDSKERRMFMSWKASITCFFVLVVFAIGGNLILRFFGITIDAFLIAGGIFISAIGWNMVESKRERLHHPKERKEAMDKEDVSIIPLAIPLLSGPGAITTSIVLMGNASGMMDMLMVILAIFLVSLVSYVVLSNSDILEKKIGELGRRIIGRLMGLIVLVIGVQFVINGTLSIIKSLL